MNKKKKQKKIEAVNEESHNKQNNTLIYSGVIVAISSIGLLIFVLSEKIFHLS